LVHRCPSQRTLQRLPTRLALLLHLSPTIKESIKEENRLHLLASN